MSSNKENLSLVDDSSMVDVTSRLDKTQARKLLSEFFKIPNTVSFSDHAQKQMKARNLTSVDVLNVLRAGNIDDDPEFENGSWRYRIRTTKITVVFAFREPNKIRIVSAWRN
jgi:hypothetical protein